MEIWPNFGGGLLAFAGVGFLFFLRGVPDFCKQGRFYPSVPPLNSYVLHAVNYQGDYPYSINHLIALTARHIRLFNVI